MHEPPIGDSQENWPTQEVPPSPGQPGGWGPPPAQPGYGPDQGPQLVGPDEAWSQPAQPGGPGGPAGPGWPGGPGGPSAPQPRSARPRRHSTAAWWGAGLALVLLLAGGGAATAELTSSSSAAPTGQAAQLNSLLNSSSSSTTLTGATSGSTAIHPCLNRAKELRAAGYPGAARAVLRRCGHPLRRLRLLGGMHGEFTFETKTGPRTLAFERGVIESVSGSDVVVEAKDGTTWSWVLESNTVIRQAGQKTTTSALSDGEHVFAAGPVISGGYDARLIVVKPGSAGSSPTPAPSSSSSPASGS